MCMKNKAAVEQSYLNYNGVYQIRRDSQTQWWASLTQKSGMNRAPPEVL